MLKIKLAIGMILFVYGILITQYTIHLKDELDLATQQIYNLNTQNQLLLNEKDQLNTSYINSQKQLQDAHRKHLEVSKQLDKMRNREATLRAKPKLVEKLINKSFSDFEKDMKCVTSLKSPC